MRLLELIRCGRPAVVEESPSPFTSPETPEKRWRQRQRQRSRGGADLTWQPSLGAISEDGVFLLPQVKSTPSPAKSPPSQAKSPPSQAKSPPSAAKTGKNLDKGRALRTAAARLGGRDSYRHYDASAVFPAFAPTLFMF